MKHLSSLLLHLVDAETYDGWKLGFSGGQPFVFHARAYPNRQWLLCSPVRLFACSPVHVRLLEAKWYNLRCYAHRYTTDYCCSVVPLSMYITMPGNFPSLLYVKSDAVPHTLQVTSVSKLAG